mmetsp:Transcript_29455/g.94585  ORF Transcript_29455/g.94585 Transcript_29455/m.94585 type:complete len:432 (+) Transcript_29455:2166-3461(+)
MLSAVHQVGNDPDDAGNDHDGVRHRAQPQHKERHDRLEGLVRKGEEDDREDDDLDVQALHAPERHDLEVLVVGHLLVRDALRDGAALPDEVARHQAYAEADPDDPRPAHHGRVPGAHVRDGEDGCEEDARQRERYREGVRRRGAAVAQPRVGVGRRPPSGAAASWEDELQAVEGLKPVRARHLERLVPHLVQEAVLCVLHGHEQHEHRQALPPKPLHEERQRRVDDDAREAARAVHLQRKHAEAASAQPHPAFALEVVQEAERRRHDGGRGKLREHLGRAHHQAHQDLRVAQGAREHDALVHHHAAHRPQTAIQGEEREQELRAAAPAGGGGAVVIVIVVVVVVGVEGGDDEAEGGERAVDAAEVLVVAEHGAFALNARLADLVHGHLDGRRCHGERSGRAPRARAHAHRISAMRIDMLGAVAHPRSQIET